MSQLYEIIAIVLVSLLCSGSAEVVLEADSGEDVVFTEDTSQFGESASDLIIGEEEMQELQSWHDEYYVVDLKGENAEVLQITGAHTLDNMQKDCYPELRESLALHSQTSGFCYRSIIQRADQRVLSFLEGDQEDDPPRWYNYNTGPGFYRGYNFDTETGKLLTLVDVITDTDKLCKLLEEQLRSRYPDIAFGENLAEQIRQSWNDADGTAWILGYQGIYFYFLPTALGMEGEDMLQAAVTFLQAPELFVEKYRQVPIAYSIELRDSIPLLYDLDMNGVLDEIEAMYAFDDNTSDIRVKEGEPCKATDVRVNGLTVKEDKYYDVYDSVASRMYLLHTAEGKNYVISYDRSMYDFMGEYCIYDIAVDQITYLGRDEIYLGRNRITDLENIRTESVGDPIYSEFLLITTYASLKKDMLPGNISLEKGENAVYYYEYPGFFKILTPLTVAKVDPYSGEVMEDAIELSVDSFVVALRTNRKSWCDFITRDGSVYRLTFNPPAEDDYNYTYEGKNLSEGCLHYMNHDYAQYKADWWVW